MAPSKVKKDQPEMSAFERKRLENIAANSAMLKDLSTTAQKITPKPAPKAKSATPRKRTAAVKKEPTEPRRQSLRAKGIEADSELAKRKHEFEESLVKEEARAKRQRVSGDININEVVADGKKWNKSEGFLSGIMRGAQPNYRTFDEDDIKETTDKTLKELRERMSGLELYEGFEPNQIKITPERIYALGFHPTEDKPLIFAGDKMGNLGIFDASQTGDVKTETTKKEENDELDEDEDEAEPAVTAFKVHARSITSLVFPADGNSVISGSYDSSIRKLDLQKEVAVEIFAPKSLDMSMGISSVAIPGSDPNLLMFSTLEGEFGRHDIRTPDDTEIFQLSDKKIGGFTLHPLFPHLVATASLDRTLKIWDLRKITGGKDSKTPNLLGEHESRLSVSHSSWSPAGHVATSSYDDTIKIHSFLDVGSWKVGHEISEEDMAPSATIRHNNQTGRWVTILKPQWQMQPRDGIQKFVIGNMNRFVDVYASDGEQLAQLGGDGLITAVPAVTHFHPTKDWVAGGTASGKLCLWM